MNQVALVWNITDDPELRYTQSGAPSQASASQSAATPRTTVSGRMSTTGSLRCTAWGSVAENAGRALKKGMRVLVAGKLVQRDWQENDGNKRQTVEIHVTHVAPDLQLANTEVAKSTAEGLKSPSDSGAWWCARLRI